MKHYINILFLFICISTNAQMNVVQIVPEIDSTFSSKLMGDVFYENRNYVGSQFFNSDWWEGDILLSSGEMVNGKHLKYNGLLDELIWLNTRNLGKFKLDKSFVAEFWLRNTLGTNYHFKQIKVGDAKDIQQQSFFAEVKVEGELSLYIYHKISVVGSVNVRKDNVLLNYNNLENERIYYIKQPSDSFIALHKIRRQSFVSHFPQKAKTINRIIKANDLNIKLEDDFIRLIRLMNIELMH